MHRCTLVLALLALFTACSDSSTPTLDGGVVDKGVDPRLDIGQRADLYLGDLGLEEPGCNVCHGGSSNAAPPKAIGGQTATSERAVGAHQAHLTSSSWHAPVRCDDCHQVPKSYVDPGHLDTALPAELLFSPLSKTGGASPSFDGARCSGVYCHGATLAGGRHVAPEWTRVDGSQVACASCHGFPPPTPHPQSSACASCHGAVVDNNNEIIAPNLHVDGTLQLENIHPDGYSSSTLHGVDFNQKPELCGSSSCHGDDLTGGSGPSCETCHSGWKSSCTFCHGGTDNSTGAPPEDVLGDTATTTRGVGAHSAHLGASTWHKSFACSDCHVEPATLEATGHLGPAPAELSFSNFVRSDGATPQWSNTTCSGTYCHGATLDGGQHTAPTWTTVDGSQKSCTSCHGMPPGGGHPASNACSICHAEVIDASNQIIAANLHIDGVLQASANHPADYGSNDGHGKDFEASPDSCKGGACHGDTYLGGAGPSCESCHPGWRTNCTFCHGGTDNTTGAPPVDLSDNTATTNVGVGAHTSHVMTTNHGAYECVTCHPSYSDALDSGHLQDNASGDVDFSGGIAAGASYDASNATCSDVYCHGDGQGQGGSAVWTGNLTGGCTACHDATVDGWSMTLSGAHDEHVVGEGLGCGLCHGCVAGSGGTISTPANHVNGVVDVCATMNIGWNNSAKSCTPPQGPCHDSLDWYPQ